MSWYDLGGSVGYTKDVKDANSTPLHTRELT